MAKVIVKDGDVEEAIRRFKRDVSRAGTIQEARRREFYLSPSQARKEKAKENRKRKFSH